MWCEYRVMGWVYNNDPAAASQGCGEDICETINSDSIEFAIDQVIRKYPSVKKYNTYLRVICKALELDVDCTIEKGKPILIVPIK